MRLLFSLQRATYVNALVFNLDFLETSVYYSEALHIISTPLLCNVNSAPKCLSIGPTTLLLGIVYHGYRGYRGSGWGWIR